MAGLKRKNLNFILADKRKKPGLAPYHLAVCFMAAVPVILAFLFLFDFYVHKAEIYRMDKELQAIYRYLNQEDVRSFRENYKNSWERARYLESCLEKQEELSRLMEGQKKLNGRMITQVEQETDGLVVLTGISYQRGILTLEAAVTDYAEAAGYAKRLEELGIFERVAYLGFQSSYDKQTLFEATYHFVVNCQLKQPEADYP